LNPCMKTILGALLFMAATTVFAASPYPDISLDDLKKAMSAKDVTLLDANGPGSYQAGHIPGALDFNAVRADLASRLPKDKNALIVAYCGNPQCGAYARAAQAARDLGYTNVKHFAPGIQGWKAAGQWVEAAQ